MTTDLLVWRLNQLGVPDEMYTIGGLGGGEVYGVEEINGTWCTYYSERGFRNDLKEWSSEKEACDFLFKTVVQIARALGHID
ncbi:MAG: hypothetical protein AAF439_00955 [Pseudomonadota bacterium]